MKLPRQVAVDSASVRHLMEQVEQVAPTPATVLLLGETGVRQGSLRQAIHELSPRRQRPMVRVSCAAIPAALIESELFGRERGAYTGALSRQIGRFEAADGSTIFLDEIGELPLDIQVKLLRVLQERVDRAPRQHAADQGRRPHHRRDQPQPRAGGRRQDVPRGSLLPPQRLPDHGPAAARARRGHPGARRGRSSTSSRARSARPSSRSRRRAWSAAALLVARQRPRAAQRDRAGGDRRQQARRSSCRAPQPTAATRRKSLEVRATSRSSTSASVLEPTGGRVRGSGGAAERARAQADHARKPDGEAGHQPQRPDGAARARHDRRPPDLRRRLIPRADELASAVARSAAGRWCPRAGGARARRLPRAGSGIDTAPGHVSARRPPPGRVQARHPRRRPGRETRSLQSRCRTSPRNEILDLRTPWSGDMDPLGSSHRRFIRVVVPVSRTLYFNDGPDSRASPRRRCGNSRRCWPPAPAAGSPRRRS